MRSIAIVLTAALLALAVGSVFAGDKPGGINDKLIEGYKQQAASMPGLKTQINAVTNNSIKSLALDRDKVIEHDRIIAFKLKSNGITNQQASGRCWMFAGLNVITPPILDKLDIESFELSQPYLSFYDKLEKANYYLEEIIRLRDRSLDDRELSLDLEYAFGDGGWFPNFSGLIKKYGIVPLSAMPETKQSSSTGRLNALTTSLLRGFASELRRMNTEGKNEKQLRSRKEEMLADVYKMLVLNYGQPPEEFVFRYKQPDPKKDDKNGEDAEDTDSVTVEESNDTEAEGDEETTEDKDDKKDEDKKDVYISETHTPQSFYDKYVAESIKDYILISNCPTQDYERLFLLEGSRNIWDDSDVTVLNMPIEKLMDYTHKSLLDSQAVWFACDVDKDNYGDSGIFRAGIYNYNDVFDLDFSLTKAEMIDFWDISPNHAMTFMGFDTSDTEQPTKWLVENSWGAKAGQGGNWYMYNDWFKEYVLIVVIDKALLSDEDRALLDQKPIRIKPWEPFFLSARNLD
ncbi:MAG TPA: C1 family peptidase [candidate division Zixibacteria bacterium]|mgnify:CR=1 FL=1|nr:C1 family peptidase [candidate division Zixibacteria bacterium]